MKSYQVKAHIDVFEQPEYSDLQVLKSAAGYYIGTVHDDMGFKEPGSRDTNYFSKPGEASKALAFLVQSAESLSHMHAEDIVSNWIELCKSNLNLDVYYRWEP